LFEVNARKEGEKSSMNKSSYKLSIIFSSLLLLICCMTITYAQQANPRKAETFNRTVIEAVVEPRGSVSISIKYKKEYGYKSDSNEAGPTSCQVFSVFARQYPSGRQDRPYPVTAEPKMRESDGYYVCEYVVNELPLNVSIQATASLAGARDEFATEAWQGGSQSQPPAGWRRVITWNTTTVVTLTKEKPTATVDFEMVYSRRAPLER